MLQARNNKDVAFTALFRLIGASPGSEVRLVDLIPPVSGEIPFETALHTALEQRADLKVAEYAVQLQRENVAAIRNRYYPTLSGYSRRHGLIQIHMIPAVTSGAMNGRPGWNCVCQYLTVWGGRAN